MQPDEAVSDGSAIEAALDRRVPRELNPMLSEANRLKLAVFCANVARGTSMSFAGSLPKASWPESARLAQAADRAGIDGFIPLGRWKNNSRSRPDDDRFLEPFTWAAGLGALTERISVFATVHMTLFHPVIAAGMSSTIDHVSRGRFSNNVVAGFNDVEFRMFGIEQLEHDERYEFADEWLSLVKRMWTSEDPFDHRGRYFEPAVVGAARQEALETRVARPGSSPAATSSAQTRRRRPGGVTTTSFETSSTLRGRPRSSSSGPASPAPRT